MTGTFPYYSDNVPGEKYGSGNYKATNGRLYKVSTSGTGTPLAWYPAPGGRNHHTGGLYDIGNEGCVWSASTEGIRGSRLLFHVSTVEPERLSWRAGGCQLRCLSE